MHRRGSLSVHCQTSHNSSVCWIRAGSNRVRSRARACSMCLMLDQCSPNHVDVKFTSRMANDVPVHETAAQRRHVGRVLWKNVRNRGGGGRMTGNDASRTAKERLTTSILRLHNVHGDARIARMTAMCLANPSFARHQKKCMLHVCVYVCIFARMCSESRTRAREV